MSKGKKIAIIVLLILIPLGAVTIYAISRRSGESTEDSNGGVPATAVDWKKLREYDLQTNTMTPELQALNGKPVKIPGFMVPLEDNQNEVTEFLLVPSPQACIHVPPPPSNQMVFVRMDTGKQAKMAWGPVWVEGRLVISEATHTYGKSTFQLVGRSIEPYRYQ